MSDTELATITHPLILRHETRPGHRGGVQVLLGFTNGYGASVINKPGSYGVELAVLDSFDGGLVYDTPVTDDVLGWLDPESLLQAVSDIAALPPRVQAIGASEATPIEARS